MARYDRHVQSWVEDRARVLVLLEKLRKIQDSIETTKRNDALRLSRGTVDAVKVGVRADGMPEYVSDGVRACIELASVRRHGTRHARVVTSET